MTVATPTMEEPSGDEAMTPTDERSLENMLRQFGPAVRAVLIRRYRGVLAPADVEDILAVALHRSWQGRGRFDPAKGSLKAWFFRIANNVALDVLKYGWHKARRLEVVTEMEGLDYFSGRPQLDAAAKELGSDDEEEEEEGDQEDDDDFLENLRKEGPDTPAKKRGGLRGMIREVLKKLPEIQQRIIWADALCPDGPVPSGQLAKEFGIPPGTVRVYRKRALDRIRVEIEKQTDQFSAT